MPTKAELCDPVNVSWLYAVLQYAAFPLQLAAAAVAARTSTGREVVARIFVARTSIVYSRYGRQDSESCWQRRRRLI